MWSGVNHEYGSHTMIRNTLVHSAIGAAPFPDRSV